MRLFVTKPSPQRKNEEPIVRSTKQYIELEFEEQDGKFVFGKNGTQLQVIKQWFVFYIIPQTEHSVLMATCWEKYFDKVEANWQDKAYQKLVAETWPALATLYSNGLNKIYSSGALLPLHDLDTGDRKWFIVSYAGNLDFNDPNTLLEGNAEAAFNTVRAKSFELLEQLLTKRPKLLNVVWQSLLATMSEIKVEDMIDLADKLAKTDIDETTTSSHMTSLRHPSTFKIFEDELRRIRQS